MELGFALFNSSAFETAPAMPLAPSVRTISAPYAASSLRLSMLIVSGITITALYPLEAATIARPTPVLPLVGSIIVPPGLRVPAFSASAIILRAGLSLALPPGFTASNLTRSSASIFSIFSMLFILTRGVPPISSVTFCLIFLISISFHILSLCRL